MKKLFAIVVSGGVLLFQAKEIALPATGWYWPFMDYPMYSESHQAGDVFHQYRYVALPCDTAADARVVRSSVLGVKFFDLQFLLEAAASNQERRVIAPDVRVAAIEKLSRLMLVRVGDDVCGAGVEVRRHRIENGIGHQVPPWTLERTWPLVR